MSTSEAPQSDRYVVETTGLTKRFGDRVAVSDVDLKIPRGVAFGYLVAVSDVDLKIPRGVAFGYLGPNGAGKTTLIRMLLGLTPATSGTMRVRGLPVPDQREEALSRVGAIVEEPRFHSFMSGRENLELVAAARNRAAHGR